MRIFISWSGERSRVIAASLKMWLSDVFQGEQVFMSEHDIDAGARWISDLNNNLEASDFGIICLTPENLIAPWLLFEAGALSKAIKVARVVPYLWSLKATDVTGPLAQFQGVEAEKKGTFKLLESINAARESSLPKDQLGRVFEKWWPDLQTQLGSIPAVQGAVAQQRSERSLLEEVLQLVRNLQPQRASTARNLSIIWDDSKSIHAVTNEDMAAMSTSELEGYLAKVRQRWIETESAGEMHALELKQEAAVSESKRRLSQARSVGPEGTSGEA